jgi:hypothetical protein
MWVEDAVAAHGDIAHALFERCWQWADRCLWPVREVCLLPFATDRMKLLVSASMAENFAGLEKVRRQDDIGYEA